MDIGTVLPSLLKLVPVTLFIIVVSGTLGLIISVIVSMLRVTNVPVLSQLAGLYVSFTRSVPIVVQLFLVFYGLPFLFRSLGMEIPGFGPIAAGIAALCFYHAGYVSEVLRPAFLAVDRGQTDAARSFGYSRFQRFWHVERPQLVPIALPGYGNALIYLIHDTALVSVIGVLDIMGRAHNIMAESSGSLAAQIYLAIAIIYCIICLISSSSIRFFEKRTEKYGLGAKLSRGSL